MESSRITLDLPDPGHLGLEALQPAIELATHLQDVAYCPYSGFPVGAALVARTGRTYGGCNIENASFSLTICAERVALYQAMTESERDFVALVLASRGGVTPCGACRQSLAEFAPELPIWLVDTRESPGQLAAGAVLLSELLPHRFALKTSPNSDDVSNGPSV